MRFLVVLLSILPFLATADLSRAGVEPEENFIFTTPTEYTSGDPLDPATEIAQYNLYCRQASGEYSPTPYVVDGYLPAGSHTVSISRSVLLDVRGKVRCTMTAVTVDGVMSERGNEANRNWMGPPKGIQLEVRPNI